MKALAIRAMLAGLAATAASAQTIEWTLQQRSVNANAPGASQSFTAPDFGPFGATATAVGQSVGFGSATQYSAMGPTELTYSGYSQCGVIGYGGSGLRVDFTLPEAAAFTLTGTLDAYGGSTSVSLRTFPGGETLYAANATFIQVTPVDATGILASGRYTLVCSESSTGLAGARTTSNCRFAIPESSGLTVLLAAAGLRLRRRGGAGRAADQADLTGPWHWLRTPARPSNARRREVAR